MQDPQDFYKCKFFRVAKWGWWEFIFRCFLGGFLVENS